MRPSGRSVIPATLLARAHPLSPKVREVIRVARGTIRAQLRGLDSRFLVVVGPCSIHDPAGALEYAARLAGLADAVRGRVVLVMRTCFEKPRSTGGWKGLVNDPHLDDSGDLEAGLIVARRLLIDINALGVPCATEFLEPLVAPYLADLISWGWVGARTSESQSHRTMASGLPMPVGFKNGTDGRIETASSAALVARKPHATLAVGARGRLVRGLTPGNPDTHVVLRGGRGGPNYGPEFVVRAAGLLDGALARPVLVDCAHDNSGKDPARQGPVCRAVLGHYLTGRHEILGVILESYLRPGKQALGPLATLLPGVSVTDPCLGWEETADLIHEVAGRLEVLG